MTAPSRGPFGDDEAVYGAAVGPAWKEYYRPRFVAFASGSSRVQWNWAAALVPFWSAHRKISLLGSLVVVVFLFGTVMLSLTLSDFLEDRFAFWTAYSAVVLALGVLQGCLGSWFYCRKVRADVRRARQDAGPAVAAAVLARRAPRRGIAHDVVHGLTAAVLGAIGFVMVALPSSSSSMNKGGTRFYLGMDLHGLAAAQDSFRLVHGHYTMSLDSLGYRAQGGSSLEILEAGATSVRALATRRGWEQYACVVTITPGRDTMVVAFRRSLACGRRRRVERR